MHFLCNLLRDLSTSKDGKERKGERERESQPEGRYQRALKSAVRSGSPAGTTMSWGGGGAAGVSSSTGSGRGRGRMGGGGRFKGRKSMPPAWAQAGGLDDDEGAEVDN